MMKTKASTYVRKLTVGDVISDSGRFYLVTRNPLVVNGSRVEISLAPLETGKRQYSHRFLYDIDARVKMA